MKPLKLQQTKCEMENGNILTAPKTHTSSEPFGHVLLLRKLSSRECENKLWKSWSCQLVCMWTSLERSTSSSENICCIFFYCNNLYATTRTAAATPNGANIFNCQLSSDSSEKNDHLPSRRSVVLCLSLTLSCCHNTFHPMRRPALNQRCQQLCKVPLCGWIECEVPFSTTFIKRNLSVLAKRHLWGCSVLVICLAVLFKSQYEYWKRSSRIEHKYPLA